MNCTRCLRNIDQQRLRSNPVVCNHCGNVHSPQAKAAEAQLEKNSLYLIIASAVLMVAGFIHVANWGSASFQVVLFRTADVLGVETPTSIERMAKTCLELKKFDCTEDMYARLSEVDSRNFARLGKLQLGQRKFKEASESFRRFFASGGGDIDVNYMYARALAETGEIQEATKHFDYVLAAKPNIVQITVVQNYVKYLVAANQLDHAKQVIQRVRQRDRSISSFMESELKDIRQRQGEEV